MSFLRQCAELSGVPATAGVLSGTPAAGSQGSYTAVCTVRDSGGNTAQSSLALTINAQPVLSIVKSHTGNFTQGQTGATYSVVVSNSATAGPTSGTVTVVDTLPAALTATAIGGGTNWNCTLATLTCTNDNVLAAGARYPTITVTVNDAKAADLLSRAVAARAALPQDRHHVFREIHL